MRLVCLLKVNWGRSGRHPKKFSPQIDPQNRFDPQIPLSSSFTASHQYHRLMYGFARDGTGGPTDRQ